MQNKFILLLITVCSISTSYANVKDSTILDIRIFDSKRLEPVNARVTLFLNSDFIVHDSLTAVNGDCAKLLTQPGFYLIEIFSEDHVTHTDTLWLISETNRIIEKQYFIRPIEPGFTISTENIHFYFNSTYLKPDSEAILDFVVAFLDTHPSVSLEIAGHTDDEGPADYNLTLSDSRARSIAKYLMKKGIHESRLSPKGYGESTLLDPGITKAAKARNRRVEFIVTEVIE